MCPIEKPPPASASALLTSVPRPWTPCVYPGMARRPTPVWWCIWWDPFGLACFVFGISVVLLVDYVTVARVLWPWFGFSVWGVLHATVFQTMIVLILASYLMASMTNPGAVDLNSVRTPSGRWVRGVRPCAA